MIIYVIIELHFLASTLSFLASADLTNLKELFADKVIETSFLMLDRGLALYTDHFKWNDAVRGNIIAYYCTSIETI